MGDRDNLGMPDNNTLLIADEIDLRGYLKILTKWRWVIALITALAVGTSGVLSFFVLPPVYQSRATILVANAVNPQQRVNPTDAVGLQGVVDYLSRLPQLTINTYVSQLTSQNLLKRTAEAMKLDPTVYTPETLAGMVRAKAIKDTNLIEITVTDTDAALAANLANALTREFLRFVSESNQSQLGRSVQFLEEQLKGVDRDLGEARKKLAEFESQPRGVEYLAEQMKTRSDDLNRYEAQARQVQVDIRLLKAGLASAEASLERTPREISVTAAEGTGTRLELNPAWTALAQLAESKRVELAQKEAEAAALTETIAALEEDLRGLQVELTARRAERERFQADVDRLARTRDLLAGNITETRIARSVDLGQMNIDVISPALQPTAPVKPKKALNLAVALVLGLIGGISLAFLLEHLDNTVKTAEDVERELGLPVLGSIPVMSAGDLRS